MQPFLPCGAVTGIGSLPMHDARDAIGFVAENSPVIPFWPQLPNRSRREHVVLQGLGSLSDLVEPRAPGYGYRVRPGAMDVLLWHLEAGPAEIDERSAAGLVEFERALQTGVFDGARALKGQLEGPITTASYLFDGDRSLAAVPDCLRAVAAYVARLAQAQIRMLRQFGLPVLFFVDEPGLCLICKTTDRLIRDRALAGCLGAVRDAGAIAGLHCCAAQPIDRMCLANPDILSFDAHQGLECLFKSPEGREFLQRGGTTACGLIPTWECLSELKPESIFARWLHAASQLGNVRDLARRTMVTATCGLGLVSESAARSSFSLAHAVSALLARVAYG